MKQINPTLNIHIVSHVSLLVEIFAGRNFHEFTIFLCTWKIVLLRNIDQIMKKKKKIITFCQIFHRLREFPRNFAPMKYNNDNNNQVLHVLRQYVISKNRSWNYFVARFVLSSCTIQSCLERVDRWRGCNTSSPGSFLFLFKENPPLPARKF